MFEIILESFKNYYGLDWLAFTAGLSGTYLLTNKNYWGFFLSGIACLAGLSVATISGQFGFIAYNLVLIVLMSKGFLEWRYSAASKRA